MKIKNSKVLSNVLNIAVIVCIVLLVATVLIMATGKSPVKALDAFIFGIFGTMNGFAEVFVKATPLIFAGLGVAIAFKSGFFNIGAEGQILLGAIGASWVTLFLTDLSGPVRILVAILAAFICGGLWALIPGLLKVFFNISEIITTIMLNYIAINLVAVLVRGPLKDQDGYLPHTKMIDEAARLPELLPPTRLHAGFIIALIAVAVLWYIMKKSTIGYELEVVGLNKRAAKVNGISVMKNIIRSAVISGGLAGLAGMGQVLGIQYRLLDGISGGDGYTAILVALLGMNNPIGVCLSAIGFAGLQVGSNTMQRQLGIPASIVLIIIGLFVLLILAKDYFIKENKIKALLTKKEAR